MEPSSQKYQKGRRCDFFLHFFLGFKIGGYPGDTFQAFLGSEAFL